MEYGENRDTIVSIEISVKGEEKNGNREAVLELVRRLTHDAISQSLEGKIGISVSAYVRKPVNENPNLKPEVLDRESTQRVSEDDEDAISGSVVSSDGGVSVQTPESGPSRPGLKLIGRKYRNWTQEEDELVLVNVSDFRGRSLRALAEKLDRSTKSIASRKSILKRRGDKSAGAGQQSGLDKRSWTQEEDDVVINCLGKRMTNQEYRDLAETLGRTEAAVRFRRCDLRKRLGLVKPEKVLRAVSNSLPVTEGRNHREQWTHREIEKILAPDRPDDHALSVQLGRSVSAIRVMRSKMR